MDVSTPRAEHGEARGSFTFRVICPCGHALSGPRLDQSQQLACPQCGAPVFVLPRSPWLRVEARQAPLRWRTRDWLMPLAGTAAAFIVVVVAIAAFMSRDSSSASRQDHERERQVRFTQARELLSRGHFALAHEILRELVDGKAFSHLPPTSEMQSLAAEAGLLVDLLDEPIESLLVTASGMDQLEWERQFNHRYRGKSFILDAEFQRDERAGVTCSYRIEAGKEPARFEFGNVPVLRELPVGQPRRLLLGVRLESIRRETPGPAWVVRFAPETAIVITDPAIAAQLCPDLGQIKKEG